MGNETGSNYHQKYVTMRQKERQRRMDGQLRKVRSDKGGTHKHK